MAQEPPDVAELFERLKQELRAAGPRGSEATPMQARLSARDQAERLWPVSAERPVVRDAGGLRRILRRMMRWYVEPPFQDQRAFNEALLKLIDDLDERVARLEQR